MRAEFPAVTIGDVCTVCDGAHAKVKRQPSGVEYLTSKNIRVGRLALDDVTFISEDDFARLFSPEARVVRRPSPGDVLMGIIGTFGTAYRVKETDRFGVASAVAILRPDQCVMDSAFLYYSVTSPSFRKAHHRFKSGSAQGYTNLPTIRRLPLRKPPIEEQRRIAGVLGALDDKIELNRKMNRTLEEMAQAIFKSWFIDFDGVDASEMVDSELGPIPKGWEVMALGGFATVKGGKQLERSDYSDDGPFRVFGANGVMGMSTKSNYEGFVIAFGRVGAYCGSVHWSVDGAWINNNASAVYPEEHPEFVLQSMLSADWSRYRRGSAQPFISNGSLSKHLIIRPSGDRLAEFCAVASVLRRRQATNELQSRTLADLRDTLLPKLISGEIRVPAAEKTIEAAL